MTPLMRAFYDWLILAYVVRCPSWAADESIACRNVNNELHFFEENNFGMWYLDVLCWAVLNGKWKSAHWRAFIKVVFSSRALTALPFSQVLHSCYLFYSICCAGFHLLFYRFFFLFCTLSKYLWICVIKTIPFLFTIFHQHSPNQFAWGTFFVCSTETIANKLHLQKVSEFALSPGCKPNKVGIHFFCVKFIVTLLLQLVSVILNNNTYRYA